MEPPPVQYVATPDGYNLAYAVAGSGTPLVFLPLGLNHVQLAWRHDGRISDWLKLLSSRSVSCSTTAVARACRSAV